MSDTWEKIDADRVYMSDYQALSNTKVKRKKKRKKNLRMISMYKSQGRREVNKDKEKITKKGRKGDGQGKSKGHTKQKGNVKRKGKRRAKAKQKE